MFKAFLNYCTNSSKKHSFKNTRVVVFSGCFNKGKIQIDFYQSPLI